MLRGKPYSKGFLLASAGFASLWKRRYLSKSKDNAWQHPAPFLLLKKVATGTQVLLLQENWKPTKKHSMQALGVSWTSESRSYAATWIAWSWSQVICFELLFHIDPQLRLIQDNIQCETHWSCRLIQRDISRKASWWVKEIAIILIQLLIVIKLYYDMTRPKTGKHIITGKTFDSIWW